jgi:hypothetical protein
MKFTIRALYSIFLLSSSVFTGQIYLGEEAGKRIYLEGDVSNGLTLVHKFTGDTQTRSVERVFFRNEKYKKQSFIVLSIVAKNIIPKDSTGSTTYPYEWETVKTINQVKENPLFEQLIASFNEKKLLTNEGSEAQFYPIRRKRSRRNI